MTLEEAKKVAKILETADNGCPICVSSLAAQMGEAFPEFSWRFLEEDYGIAVKVKEQS